MKNCNSCVFFEKPKDVNLCGMCGYPVPEYIRICGCPYIANPEFSGQTCVVHKSKLDVMNDETSNEKQVTKNK